MKKTGNNMIVFSFKILKKDKIKFQKKVKSKGVSTGLVMRTFIKAYNGQ